MKRNLLNNIRYGLALIFIYNIGALPAQEVQDSARIYFHQGHAGLDLRLLEKISTQDGVDGQDKLPEFKKLQGGEPYMYMYKHLFPELRSSTVKIWYEAAREKVVTDTLRIHTRDTLYLHDTIAIQVPAKKIPVSMAMTTNLLYDALAVPNIGIEIHLGKSLSLAGNWMYAWWKSDRKHNYWRTYGGDIELRCWFGKKSKERLFTGHHAGIYGQILTYDFELGGKGYLGDKWSYGFGGSYGYSIPIIKNLNIDFSLGIGYLWGEYKEYVPRDGHYVWQATRKRKWFGPTKVGVSLVWLIGKKRLTDKMEL